MELTIELVVATNKAVQEVSADADTLRKRDKLEQIAQRVNRMLRNNEEPVAILAYILHSIPIEQPFNNGNHRTAPYLFYEYCYHFGKSELGEVLSARDESFLRFLEFLTLSELERELRKLSLKSLK